MNTLIIRVASTVAMLLAAVGCAQKAKSVRDFGAAGDGKTADTRAFQRALDGGGEVIVPAGEYLIGSVTLPSNTTLRLEKDAHIRGTDDLKDYPVIRGRWEGRWVDAHQALIAAHNATNIAIVGPGKISGNPALGGRQMPRRPCVIEPINCTNIRLEGFTIEQKSMWTIHPTLCDDIVARDLTIRSTGGNGDGIDLDSCRRVLIENCDIATGDDCIALKSGRGMEGLRQARPTEDVIIRDCTFADSIFACVAIGSEMSGSVRNVTIERCKFTSANTSAIYIKSRPGRGGVIENVTASDLDVANCNRSFLRINLLNSGLQDPEPVPGEAGVPQASNFSFTNIRMTNVGKVVETAISPEKPLRGRKLINLSGDAARGIELSNVRDAELRDINITGITGAKLATHDATGIGLEDAVPYEPATAPATTQGR